MWAAGSFKAAFRHMTFLRAFNSCALLRSRTLVETRPVMSTPRIYVAPTRLQRFLFSRKIHSQFGLRLLLVALRNRLVSFLLEFSLSLSQPLFLGKPFRVSLIPSQMLRTSVTKNIHNPNFISSIFLLNQSRKPCVIWVTGIRTSSIDF
jgi:hypothetical protein